VPAGWRCASPLASRSLAPGIKVPLIITLTRVAARVSTIWLVMDWTGTPIA